MLSMINAKIAVPQALRRSQMSLMKTLPLEFFVPEGHAFRLHCLLYHTQQFGCQNSHIRLIPRRLRKLLQHLLRIILLAVKAAVDEFLYPVAQRIEESGDQ